MCHLKTQLTDILCKFSTEELISWLEPEQLKEDVGRLERNLIMIDTVVEDVWIIVITPQEGVLGHGSFKEIVPQGAKKRLFQDNGWQSRDCKKSRKTLECILFGCIESLILVSQFSSVWNYKEIFFEYSILFNLL